MEGKLYAAAITGDALQLDKLTEDDPEILNRVITAGAAIETPLHIAAQLGHIEFVRKIRSLKPEFSQEKNSQGRCPLHLASAKGHVEIVAELLEMNSDVCFVRDQDGRTPFHIAAMKGRIEVLKKLAEKDIKAAWVMADCGQPILHLCANHDQFNALKLIIECMKDKEPEKLVEFVNLKDDDDNTILHLLAAKAQYQVISFLIPEDPSKNDFKVDVNAINIRGSTALDVLYRSCGTLERMRIKYLLGDGAKRAKDIPGSTSHGIIRSRWELLFKKKTEVKSETRDALMVVAILIATVSFQTQMSPPGGVWQEDGNITTVEKMRNQNNTRVESIVTVSYTAGQSVMSFNDPGLYDMFTLFNIVAFGASLILILLLVSGFTLRRKVSTWALTVITWTAVLSMATVFTVLYPTLKSTTRRERNVVTFFDPWSLYGWFVLMILLALTLIAYAIKYVWMHLHKVVIRSVKKGFNCLFCCRCFSNSSKKDSEGRNEMNA